ncbi:MAG: hypothetical protein HUU02_07650 [Bacteroidetes bacterium]|nr:hypothetical protein [Bacteroidota bacterium]
MKTAYEFINYVSYLWPRRKTWLGLALSFIGVLGIYISLSLNNEMLLAIVLVGNIIFWAFDSGRLVFPSKKITIAFALKPIKPESHSIIEQTILKLFEKLKSIGAANKFRVLVIGSDIFSTNEQAEKYVKKKKVKLVIHGNVWNEKKGDAYIFDLKNFFFSYMIGAGKNSPQYELIQNDINLMLVNRDWRIEEINSLSDLDKVSNNLVEIVLSIVAISLATFPGENAKLSISLIEQLLPFLDKHLKPEERKIRVKKDNTLEISINVLRSGRLRTILHDCYIIVGDTLLQKEEYKESFHHFEKALKIGGAPLQSLTGMAVSSYFLKNIDDAWHYSEELQKLNKHHPNYAVNLAFLSIVKRQYSEAEKYYEIARSIIKKMSSEPRKQYVSNIVSFLNQRLSETPSEIGYNYAIGILIYNFIDKEKGKIQLRKFYSIACTLSEYIEMKETTKLILKA